MSQAPEKTELTPNDRVEFFLVITPGFEALAEKEVRRVLLANGISLESETDDDTFGPIISHGGITLKLPLDIGCELNRVLKIPTRVLLRLAAFGCRDFPKLFKKTAGFSWAEWVEPGHAVEFQASTHKSRLFIKKRIEETCLDGFKRYSKEAGWPASAPRTSGAPSREPVQIMVRIDDDVCMFSIDTSGERLHKRGTKLLSAEAPLRETIAAALLNWMSDEVPTDVTLIDPMVGSGTFLIEAADLKKTVATRGYAFENFPIYQRIHAERASDSVSSTAEVDATVVVESTIPNFVRFVGIDIDAKAAEATRGNWRELGDQRPIDVRVADIFDTKPFEAATTEDGERWIIANPPYGERLAVQGRLKDYYELLFEACERVVRPQRACFLLPNTAKPEKLRAPKRWKFSRALKFQNGGLPVTALLYIQD